MPLTAENLLATIKNRWPDLRSWPSAAWRPTQIDRAILGTVLALSLVGIVAVYSATAYLAASNGTSTEGLLLEHFVRLVIAIGAMIVFSQIDYHVVARFSKLGIFASVLLLIWVLIQGDWQGGARRAIFGFRPSDIARFALIVHVAVLLTRKQLYIQNFGRGFLPVVAWGVIITILIGAQNVSTAMVLLMTVLILGFIGRMKLVHLGGLLGLGLLLAVVMLLLFPARAERIESYLGLRLFSHTNEEMVFSNQGERFQILQAQIAIANGSFTGKGIGKSTQKDWIPAAYSDFIFAIIAEEFGILGALIVVSLLGIFLYRGFMHIARNAPDPLGFFLASGISLTIGLYGLVHVCVNTGLMPVTGLPFPFVSWGGTSLIVTGIMVGVLLNISGQRFASKKREPKTKVA
ncbi:MAG TPA: FtsW/RodA/SpoVE family cell cycle protein [Rhodothermales bacterium]|mgnify:CR=1 FL=1|nr:FtsW/RodA/SpoVE family cell cycle protein [Rhodothermales bacterium]